MSGFIICHSCNRTISKKKLQFEDLKRKKILSKGDTTDNSDILKKLNITSICCKRQIVYSQLDKGCKEYYSRINYYKGMPH